MKESRFRISHLILFLFLLSFGCISGYQFIKIQIFNGFHWLDLFYIPVFILLCVFPVVSAVLLAIDDLKNLKRK